MDISTGGTAYVPDKWAHFAICFSLNSDSIVTTITMYVDAVES
ncbi:MAG: hypothetical protein V2I33_21620 [Kangiellaceae bacterium]|nr:hypothetical protein [Kangiellaceae bacterium]